MNRRLFEDLVVSAHGRRGGRGRLAFPASLGIHAAAVGGAVLLSALGPGDLMPEVTARPIIDVFPLTIVRVQPPPPAIRDPGPRPVAGGRRLGGAPGVRPPAPVNVDSSSLPDPDPIDMEPQGCLGTDCIEGAAPGPPQGSFLTGEDLGPSSPAVVRASDVAPPVKIRNVDPVYPELARRAGVEGVVIIECTIDPKGRIANARVLRGYPLLDRAALDAVQQWVYRPTLLNGAPVSVIMTVTVRFKIAR